MTVCVGGGGEGEDKEFVKKILDGNINFWNIGNVPRKYITIRVIPFHKQFNLFLHENNITGVPGSPPAAPYNVSTRAIKL